MPLLKFPGEDEQIELISARLSHQISLGERVYRAWLFAERDKYLRRSPLDFTVKETAMTLDVQACRQYRAAFELCERSDGECAHVIARSLFETAVATAFVLLPNVRLKTVPEIDKGTRIQKVDHDGRPRYRSMGAKAGNRRIVPVLPRLIRAQLVMGKSFLNNYAFKRRFSRTKGRKKLARIVGSGDFNQLLKDIESAVGPDWLSVLLNNDSYSGLSLYDVCQAIGNRFDYYYDSIYRLQSRPAHGLNVLAHVTSTDKGLRSKWFCDLEQVHGALDTAIRALLLHLTILHEQIDFGNGMHHSLPTFRKELNEIALA